MWCDADVRDFNCAFPFPGIIGPALTDSLVGFVKGFYGRPVDGHVTAAADSAELVARPLLTMCFPELSEIVQPLSGEFGGRRAVLEQLPLLRDTASTFTMLIDIVNRFGAQTIAQVAGLVVRMQPSTA